MRRNTENTASQEYQNAYNRFNQDRNTRFGRLSQLAGYGQNADQMVNQAGQHYADAYGKNVMGSANDQGAAGMAQAGMWGNTLSGLGRMGMDYAAMDSQGLFNKKQEPAPMPLSSLDSYRYNSPIFGTLG